MKRGIGALVAAAIASSAGVARAEEPATTTVPVHVTIPGSISLRGVGPLVDARASCNGPCTLHLVPGEYRYFGGGRSNETVAFTGPSHLELRGPTEPLHTTGLVIAGVGVLAIAIPLVAVFATCDRTTSPNSLQVTEKRCVDFGGGADLPLTIVAGGGLALVAFGGILYFLTAGGLSVTDLEPTDRATTRKLPRLGEVRASSPSMFRLDIPRGQITF